MSVPKTPTPRQRRALNFIQDHLRVHGCSPSESEIARHLGISPPAAHHIVTRLAQSGLVTKTPGLARSLNIANPDADLARQCKAIVLLAFRNGPIEDIHTGKPCGQCLGKPGISRITDDEMRHLMKTAVNRIYTLLQIRDEAPEEYERLLRFADLQTKTWDAPEFATDF